MSNASTTSAVESYGFKQKPMARQKTVSEQLRQKREKLGLSLSQCVEKTNIQEHHLEAIEKAQFHNLPGEMYARGWIKKYAYSLDLPGDIMVELFTKEFAARRHIQEEPRAASSVVETATSIWKVLTLKRLALAGLVLVIVGYMGFLGYQSIAPPVITFDTPLADTRTQDNSIQMKGSTEVGVSITINDQNITIDDEGKFDQEINLRDGLNTLIIEASKPHSLSFKKNIRVIKTSPPELQETGP